jgi:hypothetical protein
MEQFNEQGKSGDDNVVPSPQILSGEAEQQQHAPECAEFAAEEVEVEVETSPSGREVALANMEPGPRFHRREITSMEGFMLVKYDASMKIQAFVGGAVKLSQPGGTTLLTIDQARLVEHLYARRDDVEPTVTALRAGGPRTFVEIHEVPYYTELLDMVTGPGEYGVMSFGPDGQKKFVGAAVNGTNREDLLDQRTWNLRPGRQVPGSGYNNLEARLAPNFVEVTTTIPTAWQLAALGLALFGGMPTMPKIRQKPVAVILDAFEAEIRMRAEKAARREAERQAQRQLQESSVLGALGANLDPATMQDMEDMVKE